MNTKGEKMLSLIEKLMNKNVKLNITAIMTIKQVEELCSVMNNSTPIIISVFAGRNCGYRNRPYSPYEKL